MNRFTVSVIVFLVGCLAGYGLRSIEGVKHKHDCVECFFNIYDGLAAKGRVVVDQNGAWYIHERKDGSGYWGGWGRPIHIGDLAPGQSDTLKVSLVKP